MSGETEVEDMGPDNYQVTFETKAIMRVSVDTHSEEEAAELVRGLRPEVDWNDTLVIDFGMEEIEILEVWT